jgi:hypothetical protein
MGKWGNRGLGRFEDFSSLSSFGVNDECLWGLWDLIFVE